MTIGIIGATITPHGTPASLSVATARSRRCGALARGSSVRARRLSSEVTETNTCTRLALRHRREQVQIAFDQCVLGDDRARMAALGEHFEDRRVIRNGVRSAGTVGIRAEVDRRTAIARLGELRAQQLGGVGLGKQPRFEIESRRQIEVAVRWPRVAVDAAVLAAAIRVDRLLERHVGRIVAADDRARGSSVTIVSGAARARLRDTSRRPRACARPISKRPSGFEAAPRPLMRVGASILCRAAESAESFFMIAATVCAALSHALRKTRNRRDDPFVCADLRRSRCRD